jgi:hypothetical protein
MAANKERDSLEKSYFVRKDSESIVVIDQSTGSKFFRTRTGGWFWLMGSDNPFQEDVQLGAQEKQYLDEIVDAAENSSR